MPVVNNLIDESMFILAYPKFDKISGPKSWISMKQNRLNIFLNNTKVKIFISLVIYIIVIMTLI
jgi:hypothetical protein